MEATGPGASVRGDFSADGVLLVRWASADFATFCRFLQVFDRLLGAFCGHWVLFASMTCAYLYVNNFSPACLAWELHSLHRSGPPWHGHEPCRGRRPEPHPGQGGRSPAREVAEIAENGGDGERAARKNCSAGPCAPRMSSNPTREGEPTPGPAFAGGFGVASKTPWQAGGRQSGLRDLQPQASRLKPAVMRGKAGGGAGERTRKPEPGNRKKGAKEGAGNACRRESSLESSQLSSMSPELPELSSMSPELHRNSPGAPGRCQSGDRCGQVRIDKEYV